MQIYTVGGAVRDALLGLPVKDHDYVVVGATPEAMLARGYKPVGKDFPVFLHPKTHEEYALARTERKTGHGYTGFAFHAAPDVTLAEDLARRDLTINAIAQAEDGTLTDPYGGVADIEARILRHVGPAFVEDPVRILRIARFAARFSDFSVAPETLDLMRRMVDAGEVDHLVPERVWQELSRGLMEEAPSRLLETLRACGALRVLLPEVEALYGVPQRADYHPEVDTGVHIQLALDWAAKSDAPLAVRYAVLLHDLGKALTPAPDLPRHPGHEGRGLAHVDAVSERLRVPVECRDVARLTARFHGDIRRGSQLRASTIVKLLEECDALRRPERFALVLAACACDFHGRVGWADKPLPEPTLFADALAAARSVDAGAIARACLDRSQIATRVHEARVAAVGGVLGKTQ